MMNDTEPDLKYPSTWPGDEAGEYYTILNP